MEAQYKLPVFEGGQLEIRQEGGARLLHGTFPYGGLAVISDRGSLRKETISPGAFRYAIDNTVDRTGTEIRLDILIAHDWNRPIASRQSGSLTIRDTGKEVVFDATLPDPAPSWVVDMERAVGAGIQTGLSPGFRPVPNTIARNAVTFTKEAETGVEIRNVNVAMLREMSVVTSGGYHGANVELRAEDLGLEPPTPRRKYWWV